MATRDEARRLLDRTRDFLRPLQQGVRRTYEVSQLRLEMASLRRSLDHVCRDLGRQALSALRQHGTLSASDVAALLRRADELEDQIAAKERQVGELERQGADAPSNPDAPGNPPGNT